MIRKLLTYTGAVLALSLQSCTGALFRHSYHLVKVQGRTKDQGPENTVAVNEEENNSGELTVDAVKLPVTSTANGFSTIQQKRGQRTLEVIVDNSKRSVTRYPKSPVKLLLKRSGGCMDG